MSEFIFDLATDRESATDFLAAATGLSKTRIKEVMNKGAVWLQRSGHTRRLRRAKASLLKGDKVSVYYSEPIINTEPAIPELIEDKEIYSVWFKPVGLLSSGSRYGDHCAINRWVETNQKPERPVFLVHRLDSNASGLMVLAHSKKIAAMLSKQFHDRKVIKRYQVEVSGDYSGDKIITTPLDEKEAISRIEILSQCKERSLLEVSIETGRKHQIRRHLAAQGHPVIGDRLYGGIPSNRIHLNAYYLEFACPITGEQVRWEKAVSSF